MENLEEYKEKDLRILVEQLNVQKQSVKKNRRKLYLWVLDYMNGKVYRYEDWDVDKQSCKDYLVNQGRLIKDCEWMITNERRAIIRGFNDEIL